MAHGRPRDPRKEQQWRQWLQQWQDSGLSVRAFCARRRIPLARFYAWRRRLQQPPPPPPTLVPVLLRDPPEPTPASALEVVLGNGRTVRVPPGFQAATLRQLLAVLEEAPPC